MTTVELRDVRDDDLAIFFRHQLDPDANRMAAFTHEDPGDRDAFAAHWAKIRGDKTTVNKTILFDSRVAGLVASFKRNGEPEVTYWIGKEYWGKGIATAALSQLLQTVTARPMFARIASDNIASKRVLEKCGFYVLRRERGFANARGGEIEECVLELRASPSSRP